MPPAISATAPILETHDVTITYLDQGSRSDLPPVPRPAVQCALMRATNVPLGFYRYMFDAIGGPHKWVSRRYLSDPALSKLVHAKDIGIYILYKDGWPAGFAETDPNHKMGTEVKFFGLMKEAQGVGLGRWFLHEVLALIWDQSPGRIVIETCTLDDPAALRLYQRMGFSVYSQAKGYIEWRG